jgi:hypothetical protein
MKHSCADMNFPYKRKCWTNSGDPLINSLQLRVAAAGCWNSGKWGLMEYKWRGSFPGWFVGLVVLVQEISILPWMLWSAQYKIFFPNHTLFRFMCPHRPATWAGNHAWPPVCKCVSMGSGHAHAPRPFWIRTSKEDHNFDETRVGSD